MIDRVRARILSGEIQPESWIKQDVLAAELGISKIPLREALRKLEEEGLVKSEVNRGFFVRPLIEAEAEDIFALRLKLEPEIVADAAMVATDADREVAAAALANLQAAIAEHSDQVPALNRAFHMALVHPARKAVTATFVERLHVLAERYVSVHLEPEERGPRANAEHLELLAAWLSRDRAKAFAVTRDHIAETLMDLRVQLAAHDAETVSQD
jgi:DNA-binding GntR family transcriptional regulator